MSRSAPRRLLPWRYGLFLLMLSSTGPAVALLGPAVGLMAGFDLAALAFMVSLAPLFGHETAKIRQSARTNDANRTLMLVITAIVSLVVLVAVGAELAAKGKPSAGMVALILATLALAWLFSNIIYTMHYAFLFYSESNGKDSGGLTIPGVKEPDYWDFAYFALTLGMTFQTSDVDIQSSVIRRVSLFHCLAAFVFNLGIIAFTINVLGGG